jgi:hypothetical protein
MTTIQGYNHGGGSDAAAATVAANAAVAAVRVEGVVTAAAAAKMTAPTIATSKIVMVVFNQPFPLPWPLVRELPLGLSTRCDDPAKKIRP